MKEGEAVRRLRKLGGTIFYIGHDPPKSREHTSS